MKFDLVSDLHIDFWDVDHQTDWLEYQSADTLVIAGDTSDWVDQTIEYVRKLIVPCYDNVLLIDGNHEHQPQFPELEESVKNWRWSIAQQADILDPAHDDVIIDGVRFIGANGWWTFDFGEPNISQETSVNALCERTDWGTDTWQKQRIQAIIDAGSLRDRVQDAQLDDLPLVMVTHSLPHPSCISWNVYPEHNESVGLYGNSLYETVFEADRRKLMQYWVFGHNHDQKDIPYGDCKLISNPRGRPRDWNRTDYRPITLEVNTEQ